MAIFLTSDSQNQDLNEMTIVTKYLYILKLFAVNLFLSILMAIPFSKKCVKSLS